MKFFDFLNENYDKLSDDDKEALNYLIHSIDHLGDRNKRVKEIDNSILKHPSKYITTLYSSVSKEDLEKIKSGKEFNKYLICSENPKIAKKYGTNFIIIEPNNKNAFCLYKYGKNILKQLKKSNIEEYNNIDGKYLEYKYNRNKEWILPFNANYEIVDEEKLIFKMNKFSFEFK